MLSVVILIAGLANLIMGVMVAIGGGDGKAKKSLVAFSFATFVWGVFVFMIYKADLPVMVRFSYSGGALMITTLIGWAYHYTSKKPKNISKVLIYGSGFFFALLPFFGNLMIAGILRDSGGGFEESEGPLFYAYAAYVLFAYIYVLFKLIKEYRGSVGDSRRQNGLILAGILIFVGLSILFVFILPIFGYEKLIDFDVPLSMIFVALTTYAMVKYKWMDLKIIAVQLLSLLIVSIAFVNIFNSNTLQEEVYNIFSFLILSILTFFLVRNVTAEVERKEQLQAMADKLAMANEELKKLDNAKTEFLSIASHQLRTPLTAIKGFISLILEGAYGKVEPEMRGALNKISISSERLIQLVEDLLNVSRIESGRMQYRFESASLSPLLEDLCENFALVAKQRDLYLDLKLPEGGLPEINMDPAKMREVLSNLIDNALKYTEKGGVTVRVEKLEAVNSKTKASDVVRVTVADTGIGIPAEEIPYLFQKFSRGKDTKRLHVGGTGLGLYVGKNIVAAHGGQIWIESDGAGRGTRFVVELPISKA